MALAINTADAFWGHSRPFLERVGRDITTAHERAIRDVGGMVASATNLAFSIEMYLKALRVLSGIAVIASHDLWALYKTLPLHMKTSIESRYSSLGSVPQNDVHTLELQVSIGPFCENQEAGGGSNNPGIREGNSLESVMKRNKDVFQTWRYIYERGTVGKICEFRYEFYFLDNVAKVLRSEAVSTINKLRHNQK